MSSELTVNEDTQRKRVWARNSDTFPDVLEELSDDDDTFVRAGVARNTSTPFRILKKLAHDKNFVSLSPIHN